MKMVASSCWRLSSGIVLGLMLLASTRGNAAGLNPADPQMGFQLDARTSAAISPVKLDKLQENLRHAADEYRAGRFDRAVSWYESALVIDPERADLRQALEAARSMNTRQADALKRLPADAKERQHFYEMAYQAALSSLDQKKNEQSYNAFYQLWLTAGDFNGKTVKMLDRIRASQPEAAQKAYQVASLTSDQDAAATIPSAMATGDEPPAKPLSANQETQADLLKARAALQTGYNDDARRILNDVIGRDPQNDQARQDLALLDRVTAGKAAMNQSGAHVEMSAMDDLLADRKPVMVAQADTSPAMMAPMTDAPVAAPTVAVEVDDVTRLKVNRLIHDADLDIASGNYEPAQAKVREAMEAWPSNPRLAELQSRIDAATGKSAKAMATQTVVESTSETVSEFNGPSLTNAPVMVQTKAVNKITDPAILRQTDEMMRQAERAREAGDIQKARDLWKQILEINPGDVKAQTWLENTEGELQKVQATVQTQAAAEKRKEAARNLLNSPITISTDHEIPLTEFMNLLSFATPTELQYYVAEGARAQIYANFQDVPLHQVLDTVLNERGLVWSLDPATNVITISQKLITRTYNLNPEQAAQLRTLMDTKKLQNLIWSQTEPPAQGVDLTLDERRNLLIVTGSSLHIQRIESLLPSIGNAGQADVVTRFYKIKPSDGERIRALVDSIIKSRESSALDAERKILVDGEDLIIRDTPENIKQIEDLLLDRNFIQKLTEQKLDIQSFSLVPKDVESVKSDEIQVFTSRVVEAIKVFLYAQEGESKAAEQGRRLWFDEASLQLTVVDTPSNIERVGEYIGSLPQISQTSAEKVIELKNAVAEDLAGSLARILNLTGAADAAGGGAGGDETTIKLRRGEERQWRNVRIRLTRVEANDETDRNDDSAELSINTGTEINQVTVRELETQYTDDYEITADNVLPSTGQRGDGSASIRIRYAPRGGGLDQLNLQQQLQALQQPVQPAVDQGIQINAIGELNDLVISYTNPALYKKAVDLIAQLDRPILQVSIETKFVEVNEAKAKEVSADINLQGLGSGRSVDWSNQFVNTRFAQDADEFRSAFDPPMAGALGQNLLKGTTAIEAVFGSFPFVDYSLRLLEAEGVVNVVNGPKVTAIDGREAEFRIESFLSQNQAAPTNALVQILNPITQANGQLADVDEATQNNILSAVVLRVTPEITSKDTILLRDLSAELIDFDRYLNQVLSPTVNNVANLTQGSFFTPVVAPTANAPISQTPIFKRKKIITDARVGNGGTIVIGGWTGERSEQLASGIPVLRNMPYIGKLLFNRAQWKRDRTTLLIFLTCNLVD